jgi:DNA (cytosine-5)-methyltransferase 1
MKILNLYCGIGGNRFLWGNEHQITAIDNDPKVCEAYQKIFKNDTVLCCDAHNYLLENFKKYDFIWASPPCPTHSKMRFSLQNISVVYPDMTLYQEIILLNNFFKGLFCIENVRPYYTPLVPHTIELDRHLFWANFRIEKVSFAQKNEKPFVYMNTQDLKKLHGIDIDLNSNWKDTLKAYRNMVNPQLGKHILECATKKNTSLKNTQSSLFEVQM